MLSRYWQEARQTLWVGFPFIINQLLQISMVVIDSKMAGSDSELTLAAIAQGVILWDMVILILIGILLPMIPMIARAYTRDEPAQLREIFQQGVWLAFFLSIIGVIIMQIVPNLMTLVGVEPEIIGPATDYLRITAWSIPFIALYLPVRYLNEGIANPKAIMYITAVAIPVNVAGNYIFLNGLFGVPKMGAAGIAWASVISMIVVCLIGWTYLLKSPRFASWHLTQNFSRPIKSVLLRYIKLGVPNAIAFVMEIGMFACVVLLSGRLGVQTAAANQIAFNYASTTFMIPLGLSMALTTRVGMAMGKEDLEKARIIGVSGMMLGGLVMCLSVINITIFGESIASWYTAEPQVVSIAVLLLSLAAIFQISDGIQVCASGSLRGLEETKAPMKYAILGYWVLAMPLAITLAFVFEMGAKGLWVGLIVGLAVTATLSTRKFLALTKAPTLS